MKKKEISEYKAELKVKEMELEELQKEIKETESLPFSDAEKKIPGLRSRRYDLYSRIDNLRYTVDRMTKEIDIKKKERERERKMKEFGAEFEDEYHETLRIPFGKEMMVITAPYRDEYGDEETAKLKVEFEARE